MRIMHLSILGPTNPPPPEAVMGNCGWISVAEEDDFEWGGGGADALRYHSILAGSNFKGVVVKISKHFCGF